MTILRAVAIFIGIKLGDILSNFLITGSKDLKRRSVKFFRELKAEMNRIDREERRSQEERDEQ